MKEVEVKIGNVKYKMYSDDEYIDEIKNDFKHQMVRLFCILINKDDYILDIGANKEE